jgi:hypothetical protein
MHPAMLEKVLKGQGWWLTSVTPATWEAKIKKIIVGGKHVPVIPPIQEAPV